MTPSRISVESFTTNAVTDEDSAALSHHECSFSREGALLGRLVGLGRQRL